MADLKRHSGEISNKEIQDAGVDIPISKSEEHPDITQFSPAEQRSILRRIDWRIMPIVGLLYFISLMDRTQLGAANIAGMSEDLELTVGMRYSIMTLAFFPTYIVFELPSTVLIRWIGPRWHLSTITLTWGIILFGMGFTKSWQTMAGLRAVLGFLEAGFFPGCMYFLSTWFTRPQMHKRFAIWYFMGSVTSAFAGILCYGFMQMEGIQGLPGWRWIFIMQGIITCSVAAISYLVMVGFPDDKHIGWHFLNEREIAFVLARINADRGDARETEPFTLKSYLSHGLDIKIWGFSLIFAMILIVGYAFAFFLPIILQLNMGFSIAASLCLITPPYFTAGLWMTFCGWLGDKFQTRAPILLFNCVIALIGLPVMAFTNSTGVQYFGAFLAVVGVNANIPATMAYQSTNIRGHWKRAFCSAIFVGMGGVGGIAGSLVFRSQDAPGYRPGIYACIAANCVVVVLVLLMTWKFMRDNKKQARGELVIEGEPGFRYTT